MGDLIFILIIFALGFWIGRKTAPKQEQTPQKPPRRFLGYSERQRMKVMYETDADRIRELNALSKNESSFLRLLKQEFSTYEVVIKQKRFFIVDIDKHPIAIFEFRDGHKQLRNSDVEDGLPLFLYKGLISTTAIREDKKRIAEMNAIPRN